MEKKIKNQKVNHQNTQNSFSILSFKNKNNRYIILALFFLTFVIFSPSLTNQFAFDDVEMVTQNDLFKNLSNFPIIWLTNYNYGYKGSNQGLYRPLVNTTYALLTHSAGYTPWVFRLLNIFTHFINSALIFYLVVLLGKSRQKAFLASLIFCSAAVHSEAIICVSRLSELLACTFSLSTLIFYIIWKNKNFDIKIRIKKFLSANFILLLFMFSLIYILYLLLNSASLSEQSKHDINVLRPFIEFIISIPLILTLTFYWFNLRSNYRIDNFSKFTRISINITLITFFITLIFYGNYISHNSIADQKELYHSFYSLSLIIFGISFLLSIYFLTKDLKLDKKYNKLLLIITSLIILLFTINLITKLFVINLTIIALSLIIFSIAFRTILVQLKKRKEKSNTDLRAVSIALFSTGTAFLLLVFVFHFLGIDFKTNQGTSLEIVADFFSSISVWLAVLFSVIAIIFYVMYRKQNDSLIYLILSLLFFFLGICSKESSLLMVGIIFIYDFVFHKNQVNFRLYLPYISIFFITLLLRIISVGSIADPDLLVWSYLENPLKDSTLLERLSTSMKMLGIYIKQLVAPTKLLHDYSYNYIPITDNFFQASVLLPFSFLVGIFLSIPIFFKREKVIPFALLFFFVNYFVISNMFIVIGANMAERMIYLPSAGFYIAFIILLFFLLEKILRNKNITKYIMYALTTIFVIYHGYLAFDRNDDWKSEKEIYLSDYSYVPNIGRVNQNLASMELNEFKHNTDKDSKSSKEKSDLIIELSKRALQINPDTFKGFYTLGITHILNDNFELGKHYLDKIIEKSFRIVVNYFGEYTTLYNTFYDLAIHLEREKRWNDAIKYLQLGIKRFKDFKRPDLLNNAKFYNEIAAIYLQSNRLENVSNILDTALNILKNVKQKYNWPEHKLIGAFGPDYARIFFLYGFYYHKTQDASASFTSLKKSLEINPYDKRTLKMFLQISTLANKLPQTVPYLKKFLSRFPSDNEILKIYQSITQRKN